MIHFANSQYYFLLPIFILFGILLIRNYARVKTLVRKITSQKHQGLVLQNFSPMRQRLKLIFMLLALGSLSVAFLRPQWGKKEENVIQEGRDLLVVLDVSRSMLVKDLKPNRLEFAKFKIQKLLDKLSFERVGLILFSGSAFVSCPLTSDYSAFLMFLNQVDVESISSGTTAFDKAFLEAIKVYSSQQGHKNKLVLFVTDGEDFSQSLGALKNKSKELGIKLFALGLGSKEGAPIPKFNAYGEQIGHEVDESGKPELSRLNEDFLKSICAELGGKYFRAGYDDSDLSELVSSIEQFEKEKFEDRKISKFEDRYPIFLAASWLFLILEWIL